MQCPRCGSMNVQGISQVNTTSQIKGYGCCKGGIGAIIFGPIGWLCGLLGMGKGKTSTTTSVLWMCNNCGNKFR